MLYLCVLLCEAVVCFVSVRGCLQLLVTFCYCFVFFVIVLCLYVVVVFIVLLFSWFLSLFSVHFG